MLVYHRIPSLYHITRTPRVLRNYYSTRRNTSNYALYAFIYIQALP